MFSHRLPWPHQTNRLSRHLEEKRARGALILDLTESNPTRVGLRYPAEEMAAALADPAVAVYEPSSRGLAAARAAVAEHSTSRGRPISPDRLVLTASTSEAYALLFKLLCDPGDTVLVPRPSYPLFDYLAALEGVRVATYALTCDGRWSIDFDALERALETGDMAKPRLVVLVNPNNPTGTALRLSERSRLFDLCSRRGLAVISDEVFFDFLDPMMVEESARAGDPISSCLGAGEGARPLIFALGGLSKGCGLPQMKLGWIGVDGPGEVVQETMERLDLIVDTYLSVGTPVMHAARRLFEIGDAIRSAIAERIDRNARYLKERAGRDSPCLMLPRDGGWSAVLQVPAILPEEELVIRLLAEDDVLVHPGYFFDFSREAYLVLSLLPEPAVFAEAVGRILARADPR